MKSISLISCCCLLSLCVTQGCSTEKRQMRKYERYVKKSREDLQERKDALRKEMKAAQKAQIEDVPVETSAPNVSVDY